ncbi:MAG: hypothetical protein KGL75_07915 [Acidobacteriota bacterium]|nr:hypothetical protein [Acidobacteriota bacterium]
MREAVRCGAVLLCSVAMFLTFGARRVEAQGPAGAGAAEAAQDTPHSLNPMHWIHKDSKDSADALGSRGDVERKLTPILQSDGVLAPGANASEACANFLEVEECVAALHATHDLGLNFACVRASVTGVHTSGDLSGCKDVDQDKPQTLMKVIRALKPDSNAKQAAKAAEQEAKDDLAKIGG